MTTSSKKFADREPGEIEALLPWRAAGTLSPKDTKLVDDALATDSALAKQYEIIQDELGETVLLNENLGAPSSRALEKLFAAIDAEPQRRAASGFHLMTALGAMFAAWSPRTLAWSAVAGALAIMLQAGIIGTVLVNHGSAGFQTASYQENSAGTRALVGFKSDTTIADMNGFLTTYRASVVSGPSAGMFTVKFGDTTLTQAELDQLLVKVKAEKIVAFAAAAQ